MGNVRDLFTTIGGFLVGAAQYWVSVGAKVPETQDEWLRLALGIVCVVGGAVAPDPQFFKRQG